MSKGPKLSAAAIVFAGVIVALASLKIYFIRDDCGADLLWNADEAYLFAGVARRGARVSYAEYPWMLLKQSLYGVRDPDDQRTSVTVVHVMTSGIERHVVEILDEGPANAPDLYTPFENRIYANCQGALCKWTGEKFETATEEEQHRLDGTNKLVAVEIDKGPGGWSKRSFGAAAVDYQFAADVGKKFALAVANKLPYPNGHSTVSVDVVRPGQPPEVIWQLDGTPRRVGRAEYERAFARP